MNEIELEQKKQQIEKLKTKGLTTRQHRLKDWLESHFESGRFFTIEEICNAGLGYQLNTNPYKHDKCVCLSNDVRQINFNITERYIPIIKDAKGSIKLVESKEEFDNFISERRQRVEAEYQYINTLESKIAKDGIVPLVNQANRCLDIDEMKPVDAYMRGGKDNG